MKLLLSVVVLVVLAVGLTAGSAQRIEVQIPFAFYLNKTLMPAGTYFVTSGIVPGAVWLDTTDFRASAAVLAHRVTRDANLESGQLVFHRYGDQRYLAQIWYRGREQGFETFPVPHEFVTSHLRAQAQPRVEIILARAR